MGFWGIEVKPGKPHPYHSDNVEGRLYVTQATLGLGSSTERSILQCSVGHKSPIFLCSLLPDRIESCSLNLEFKDELVAFSVIGPRSIHLSGYFVSDEGDHLRDEYESDSGEDIAETETEDSSEFDYDDNDDDFIDDDDAELFAPSPVPNSGVVIEEIVDDDKPTKGDGQPKRSKKKNNKSSEHEDQNNSQRQIVTSGATDTSVFESEDEDGFPIAGSRKSGDVVQETQAEASDVQKEKSATEIKKKATDGNDDATVKKRKVKSTEQDDQPIRKKKKEKLKEKGKEVDNDEIDDNEKDDVSKDEIHSKEVKQQDSPDDKDHDQRVLNADADSVHVEDTSDKKKRKKKKNKKKNQESGEDVNKDQAVSAAGDGAKSTLESQDKQSSGKSSQVRTFANGLVIEELAMGKPDGKRASPGCQVSVHYIGKLKKNDKIFDSNVGRAPFKFRLGVGQVIKGWDVGVNGMRVGDKRRLTIPPSMGYGDRGAGGKIPPNSWLVFDVELVNVR